MEFVRFGGLSSVNQKGYNPEMPSMHSPPRRKGIYAFPLGCVDPFLLGGNANKIPRGMVRYVRDKEGNRVSYDENPDFNTNLQIKPFVAASGYSWHLDKNYYKVYSVRKAGDGKSYWVRPEKMKRFSYEGEIWHHLGENLKPYQILNTKGAWYLSTMEDYMIAFQKESIRLRLLSANIMDKRGNISGVRGKFGNYNTDHIEVFIEKV